MKRRDRPPQVRRSTLTARSPHTTVPRDKPPHEPRPPKPRPRAATPKPIVRNARWARTTAPKHQAGRLIEPEDATLVDVIDNLLNKGAVLNADLVLALANVDLVYLRLSAILSAADRMWTRRPR